MDSEGCATSWNAKSLSNSNSSRSPTTTTDASSGSAAAASASNISSNEDLQHDEDEEQDPEERRRLTEMEQATLQAFPPYQKGMEIVQTWENLKAVNADVNAFGAKFGFTTLQQGHISHTVPTEANAAEEATNGRIETTRRSIQRVRVHMEIGVQPLSNISVLRRPPNIPLDRYIITSAHYRHTHGCHPSLLQLDQARQKGRYYTKRLLRHDKFKILLEWERVGGATNDQIRTMLVDSQLHRSGLEISHRTLSNLRVRLRRTLQEEQSKSAAPASMESQLDEMTALIKNGASDDNLPDAVEDLGMTDAPASIIEPAATHVSLPMHDQLEARLLSAAYCNQPLSGCLLPNVQDAYEYLLDNKDDGMKFVNSFGKLVTFQVDACASAYMNRITSRLQRSNA